jgi:hypothetical protein
VSGPASDLKDMDQWILTDKVEQNPLHSAVVVFFVTTVIRGSNDVIIDELSHMSLVSHVADF